MPQVLIRRGNVDTWVCVLTTEGEGSPSEAEERGLRALDLRLPPFRTLRKEIYLTLCVLLFIKLLLFSKPCWWHFVVATGPRTLPQLDAF